MFLRTLYFPNVIPSCKSNDAAAQQHIRLRRPIQDVGSLEIFCHSSGKVYLGSGMAWPRSGQNGVQVKPSGSTSAMALCVSGFQSGSIQFWAVRYPNEATWKQICGGSGQVYLGLKIARSISVQEGVQMEPFGCKSAMSLGRCIWAREWLCQDQYRKVSWELPKGVGSMCNQSSASEVVESRLSEMVENRSSGVLGN